MPNSDDAEIRISSEDDPEDYLSVSEIIKKNNLPGLELRGYEDTGGMACGPVGGGRYHPLLRPTKSELETVTKLKDKSMAAPIINLHESIETIYSLFSGIGITQEDGVNEGDPSLLFSNFDNNGGYVSQRLLITWRKFRSQKGRH